MLIVWMSVTFPVTDIYYEFGRKYDHFEGFKNISADASLKHFYESIQNSAYYTDLLGLL